MKEKNDTIAPSYTAIPKSMNSAAVETGDIDLVESQIEFGEANEDEAREAGYIGEDGKAVDMAKPDKEGSPTGAFTDIGAGRSSVVHHH